MTPIYSPPPSTTTRTLARVYGVELSETAQAAEEAAADYDKGKAAAGLAGLLLIPTCGLSLVCYVQYHSENANEKIEGIYSVARLVINAPTTLLTGGRYKFKAGGFVFTDVWYQNTPRVMIRRESASILSKEMEAFVMVEEYEPEFQSQQKSLWERAVDQLTSFRQDPVTIIKGRLTVQDIQVRAANLIRIKAEEEARCCIRTSMKLPDSEMEEDFIKIAGVYVLAEASLPPEQQAAPNADCYIQQHIQENGDLLDTAKKIFGFSKPDAERRVKYLRECRAIQAPAARSDVPGNHQIIGVFHKAINCCFNALSELYYNRDSFKVINNRDSFESISF